MMEEKISKCNEAFTSRHNNYSGDLLRFHTETQPEYIIPLKEVKKKSNEVIERNEARNSLARQHMSMILCIESQRGYLTASDKKEFKEMFQNLVNEI